VRLLFVCPAKLDKPVADLNPVLRGFSNYFRMANCKGVLAELAGNITTSEYCMVSDAPTWYHGGSSPAEVCVMNFLQWFRFRGIRT